MIKLSGKDFKETDEIGKLLKKIDSVDEQYITSTYEEIRQFQPFLLSLLLGYQYDLNTRELDEIIKLHLIIWEYFKDKWNIKKRELAEIQFESTHNRNIEFFKYLEGEKSKKDLINTTSLDLENIRSKALLIGVLFRFDTTLVLSNIKGDLKAIVLIGIKSLIECFEEIVNE
jgi:hypothetical protein